MKTKRLIVKFFKIKRDSMFVHIVANLIIVAVIVSLYIGCIAAPSSVAATAPIYRGDDSQKKVSLMINVYWGEQLIPDILETLESHNVTCTFFIGGSWAAKNISTVQKIAEKHEIGNHGYLHKDHKKLSEKQNRDEILVCEKLLSEATGKKTRLFAPPSGSIGDNMLEVCKELDYKVIMWSKDTIDWRDNDFQLVYKRATNGVRSGDLILMHPMAHTLRALPLILDYYEKNGFKAVTVSEIISGSSVVQ
ncbi:MAG: polysaccharide deacetylase family protein [Clostridia bacterium]|nr:polysaccharide deacetylase family protein [Clostridia bacterium]